MPIKIPDSLPARQTLEGENIFVMTEYRAMHQDIRPLKLLILNLMPTKIVTETQLLRKFSNTPLQIQVELLQTVSHSAQNVDSSHLESFYTSFSQIKDKYYDGLVITGAPVENMEFTDVDYWDELCQIMAWSTTHVHSTMHICWGAQAGLYYHYGIPKYSLPKKLFGVFPHKVLKPSSPLFRGFDDVFDAPHSRYTEVLESDIRKVPELEVIATSPEAGVFAVKSTDSRHFFLLGHLEYDRNTLYLEYKRDKEKGKDIDVPKHYFPNDDPTQTPIVRWRSAGQLIYTNWLNYYVYQTTPYDLDSMPDQPENAKDKT
jgi:homoserine O-succinyltransferase